MKRIAFALLALCLVLPLSSCRSTPQETATLPATTAPQITPATEEETPPDPASLYEEAYSLLAYSETGKLTNPGMIGISRIKSAADFEEYRPYFSMYREKDIDKALEEQYLKGYVAVVEVIVPDPAADYSLSSVYREGTTVSVLFSLILPEEDAPAPEYSEKHAFFLFCLDENTYAGETVDYQFGG